MIHARTYDTPVGDLSVLATEQDLHGPDRDGPDRDEMVVIAAGFCAAADLWERIPESSREDFQEVNALKTLDGPIRRYLDGDVDAMNEIPLAQHGTDLQQEVWQGLRDIPAGQTKTYSQLAAATSKPKAVRAVGTACGRNLIAPFVPCHRALRSDGSLGGYYYGLDVKRWLLDHESGKVRA